MSGPTKKVAKENFPVSIRRKKTHNSSITNGEHNYSPYREPRPGILLRLVSYRFYVRRAIKFQKRLYLKALKFETLSIFRFEHVYSQPLQERRPVLGI